MMPESAPANRFSRKAMRPDCIPTRCLTPTPTPVSAAATSRRGCPAAASRFSKIEAKPFSARANSFVGAFFLHVAADVRRLHVLQLEPRHLGCYRNLFRVFRVSMGRG